MIYRYLICFLLSFIFSGVVDQNLPTAKDAQVVKSRGIKILYHQQVFERKLLAAIESVKSLRYSSEVYVRILDNRIILIGSVRNDADLIIIKKIVVNYAPGYQYVFYLDKKNDLRTWITIWNDFWAKLRVSAILIKMCGWSIGQVRVLVYNNNIYLIGPTSRISDAALDELFKISFNVIKIGG